jgi:hypothetical protein
VVLPDNVHHSLPINLCRLAGVDKQAKSFHDSASSAVGYVAIHPEWHPVASCCRDIPYPGARAGEIKADERDRSSGAEDDVVDVGVVVADNFIAVGGGGDFGQM